MDFVVGCRTVIVVIHSVPGDALGAEQRFRKMEDFFSRTAPPGQRGVPRAREIARALVRTSGASERGETLPWCTTSDTAATTCP